MYLRKRMRRLIPLRPPAATSAAAHADGPAAADANRAVPRFRLALAGEFDRQRVRHMLDEHFGSGPAAVYEVSSLLTLAEATRVFIDSPLATPPAEAEPDLGPAPVATPGASPRAVPA